MGGITVKKVVGTAVVIALIMTVVRNVPALSFIKDGISLKQGA